MNKWFCLVAIIPCIYGCLSPDYVKPISGPYTKVHFKFYPTGKRNHIETFESFNNCSGRQTIAWGDMGDEKVVEFKTGDFRSFRLHTIIDYSVSPSSIETESCQIMFTMPFSAQEYLISLINNAEGCVLNVDEIGKSGGRKRIVVQKREWKEYYLLDTQPSWAHCE